MGGTSPWRSWRTIRRQCRTPATPAGRCPLAPAAAASTTSAGSFSPAAEMRAPFGILLSAPVALSGDLAAAQPTVAADGNWRNRITSIARYDDGEVVERLTSADGRFAIHFSRSGRNAIPARDADGDGLPDQLRAVRDTLVG